MKNGGRFLAGAALLGWGIWIFRKGLRAPFVPPCPPADLVAVGGAAGGLLLALALSFFHDRAAAPTALLGGTAASLALALRPGAYAGPFFLAFLPVVLPCLAAAWLWKAPGEETAGRKKS
ncbi:MAG: hypothetical protein ACP5VN_02140 [Acidobacteriota bacterium]